MGNFLVIVAPETQSAESARLFDAGLSGARQIKKLKPNGLVESDWVKAASFPRQNSSEQAIVVDPRTDSWLIAAGTWFHSEGYSSGDEARLLTRIVEIGIERSAQELEGFFVIVFADEREKEIGVITDIIGSRHCFVRSIGEIKALSTSSLLLASLDESTVDDVGCEEFLRTGVVYENRTFFREVRKVGPARISRYGSNGSFSERVYWNISQLDPEKLDGKRAARELSEKLVIAAQKVCKKFARPVCDLTGGYDSRALVAAFLAGGADFETTVAGSVTSPDVIVSKGLSRLTLKPHRHFENDAQISHAQLEEVLRLTDGEYDLVDYARIYSLHQRLSSRFDVSINGSFGELARGYWWELLRPRVGKREPLDSKKIASQRYVVDPVSVDLFPRDSHGKFIEHFAQVIERTNSGLVHWPNTAQMDNIYLELRMQHWQGRIASSTDQVWPCLSPFMMRSVLETMLQIGHRWRYRSLIARMMLAELRPDLAAYPLEHGYPPAPLTLRTWPRFLPSIKVYGKKFWTRGRSKLIKGDSTSTESPRMRLWRQPEVSGLLDPQKMRLNELIGENRIRGFLDSSRDPHFRFEQQWNRVLSLEMALSLIR